VTYSPNPQLTARYNRNTSVLSMFALIASMLVPPLGVVLGIIALPRLAVTGKDGRGLAIASVIVGAVLTVVQVVVLVLVFAWLGDQTTAS